MYTFLHISPPAHVVGNTSGSCLAFYRFEHPVKGQGIYAYVTLMQDVEYSPELKKELVKTVRGHIGAFAAPDVIHWAPGGSLL